jgi:uncharacterized protein Yka (UPF0111/DUF47 family)
MFSLQRFVGGGDVFFDLLEQSARQAGESVEIFARTIASPGAGAGSVDQSVLARLKDKKITDEIDERLVKTFVTPLEREDIEALSNALYQIPNTLEKFVQRFVISPERVRAGNFSRQSELLQEAMGIVREMVGQLRKSPDIRAVKSLNEKLDYLEDEADRHMVELLRALYGEGQDAVAVVASRDLHDLLEKSIDRCRDVGNLVVHVVLKNS